MSGDADLLRLLLGGGSSDTASEEMKLRGLSDMSAGQFQTSRGRSGEDPNRGGYGTFDPSLVGAGGGGKGGEATNNFLKTMIGLGGEPSMVTDMFAQIGSNPTSGLAAKQDWRGMFNQANYSPTGGMKTRGQGHSTGASRGSVAMGVAPAEDPRMFDYHHKYMLDQNANAARDRSVADQQAMLSLRQRFINGLFGSLGIGDGKVHTSGTHQELFRNAGAPLPVDLTESSTRDITPQERASLISAILGGM